ncbi:MAG TPA: type II toxin-antitoxin system VapC family toxin [Longimicrobium sp.]|nr:type II toxin-antitoxin system VapC family toxin [Longimicrobium sp.]
MRLLLDTHALLWWLTGDQRMPGAVSSAIKDASNEVLVSAASAWEITTKYRIGKLPTATRLVSDFDAVLRSEGFEGLPITIAHAQRGGLLPGPHKDPFDRMLVAQAQAESLALVSNEDVFDQYEVVRLWG